MIPMTLSLNALTRTRLTGRVRHRLRGAYSSTRSKPREGRRLERHTLVRFVCACPAVYVTVSAILHAVLVTVSDSLAGWFLGQCGRNRDSSARICRNR